MNVVIVVACLAAVFAASPSAVANDAETPALVDRLVEIAGGPSRRVLDAALAAYQSAAHHGVVARAKLLTVIDYTRPSTEPRLWVLDLDSGRVLYRELVAHGKASGDNTTRAFSNAPGSLMSSVGLFLTDASYVGRTDIASPSRPRAGVNDHAYERAIVLHGATSSVRPGGAPGPPWPKLGLSAVRAEISRPLIDLIKGGTVLCAADLMPRRDRRGHSSFVLLSLHRPSASIQRQGS